MSKALFIDIQDKEISTYTFDLKKGRYELKDTRKYPVSDKYNFSFDVVKENIEDAYLSLPLSSLNFRVIDLPFSDKDRIREVLPFELDGMILGGSEKVVFDDIIVGKSDNTYQVLAVFLDKKNIREILEKLKSQNIDPVFITSLELRTLVKDFNLTKLLSPILLEDKERITLAVEEMNAPTINLRRNEFSYTRDRDKTRKSLRVTAVLLILIAFVLSADLLFKIVSTRQEIASLKNEIRKQYQDIFPNEKNIMNELYQLKAHMKELRTKEEVYIGVNPLDVFLKLSQVDKQGIVFNEVTVDRGNLVMKGESPSLSDIQQLKDKLVHLFDEATIADSKSSAQGKMLFTITAKEKKD